MFQIHEDFDGSERWLRRMRANQKDGLRRVSLHLWGILTKISNLNLIEILGLTTNLPNTHETNKDVIHITTVVKKISPWGIPHNKCPVSAITAEIIKRERREGWSAGKGKGADRERERGNYGLKEVKKPFYLDGDSNNLQNFKLRRQRSVHIQDICWHSFSYYD